MEAWKEGRKEKSKKGRKKVGKKGSWKGRKEKGEILNINKYTDKIIKVKKIKRKKKKSYLKEYNRENTNIRKIN